MTLLRDGLLRGISVVLADPVSAGVREALGALDASVADDGAGAEAVVYDARSAFGAGDQDGLATALADGWDAVSAVANRALIPARKGKVVLIAPAPDAGRYAQAARSGLENLARTLSVEWARYGITSTALMPGPETSEADLGALVAFLLSRAGDYFSGCCFELR